MLAYVLAWVIGLGSLGLYLAAFFLPEIHRKNDFIWSGLGLFYALVLWVYAQRITGGILLGQTASVALISWLGWETLKLRRQLTPSEQQTELPDSTSIRAQVNLIQEKLTKQPERIAGLFTKAKNQVQGTLGAVTPRKGKPSSEATQPIQPPQTPSVVVRDAETLEKDKLEVVPPPAVTDEAVAQDQMPVEAAPITEEVKPEEVTPQSSTDEAIAKPDQGFPTEVAATAKGAEPKTTETAAAKDTQIKVASAKDNLQTKLTELQTKLADLPVRESWNKLSEQATSLFTNVKDRVQGILSTVTQRKSKPGVETTQQPTAPPTTVDSTIVQDADFDQAEKSVETASAIVMDEVVTGSTPVEDVELKIADEETASLTSEAETAPETTTELEQPESITVTEEVTEEVVLEADSVARPETDAAASYPTPSENASRTGRAEPYANTASVEETTSDPSAPNAEEAPVPVEELAPEVEVAPEAEPDWPPKTESDWPPEPEPDWSSESEPPAMEAVPPEAAAAEPEAPSPSSDLESPPSEDKEQKQNPSNSP
jgi:hypothetical protein